MKNQFSWKRKNLVRSDDEFKVNLDLLVEKVILSSSVDLIVFGKNLSY
jgi:hypothetical protein